jgi:hypothetical protein
MRVSAPGESATDNLLISHPVVSVLGGARRRFRNTDGGGQVDLPVRVAALEGEEPDARLTWSGLLVQQLHTVDGVTVERAPAAVGGDDLESKGILGTLVASFSPDNLGKLLDALRNWTIRTQRTAEVKIGDDWVKLSGLDRAQQDRVIASWTDAHPAGGAHPAALPPVAGPEQSG